ncbi:MAG: helix-hairpin-helix domain-containing protein, partial [Bacteroides sp.]|nr:helix-hairpin-helix domain-containing protein [Bacteroides sp.]
IRITSKEKEKEKEKKETETTPKATPFYTPPASGDSTVLTRSRQEKYPAGTIIDLNRADTTELKKIPGIGSEIARMIVGYRQRLGGFYSIEQLKEIHLDAARLQPWFSIDTSLIRLLNLNRAGIEKLRSHPYINFYQAKAFVEYRKKKGKFQSLKPFTLYEEFSEADLERISHYVCFE